MADEVDGTPAVLAVSLLDEVLAPLQEAAHVRRQSCVIARDSDVLAARVADGLQRRIHRLVERRTGRLAVVRDGDGDTALLVEPQAHRLVGVAVVAEGHELVAADLREGRAWVLKDEILEGARTRAVRVRGLVLDGAA